MQHINENGPDVMPEPPQQIVTRDTTTDRDNHDPVGAVSLPTVTDTVGAEDRRCSVDGCDRTAHARGWCMRHYQSARRRGVPPLPTPSPQQRFWNYVNKTSGGCWTWEASKDGSGYGQFSLDCRLVKAHRFAYELLVGPIPPNLQLDHRCFNRSCCNPAHLEVVTVGENVWRRKGANPGSASGWRGVSWRSRSGKWGASVRRHGHIHYLGEFTNELDAARAAAEKYAALGYDKPLRDLTAYLQTAVPGDQLDLFGADA